MDEFAISSEKIAAAGSGVSGVAGELQKEIAAVDGILADIRNGWQSDQAAPRYAATMQAHLEQARVMKDALMSHGTSLVEAGRQYDQAEAALAQGIPVGAA